MAGLISADEFVGADDFTEMDCWERPTLVDSEEEQYKKVIARYGSPFVLNDKNKRSALNPQFVPGLYAERYHVLHDKVSRSFYEYDSTSGVWLPVTNERMQAKMADLIIEIGKRFSAENICMKERNDGRLRAHINNLRAITDGSFENRPSGFIHCANGMLEVSTKKLFDFAPRFLSRNASPFNWNPEASAPRFMRELLEGALGQDDIDLLQRYAGLALLGRNLSQRILLLTGTPGGGKSQLCNILEGIVGRENVTQLRTEHLTERFEIARFTGKTLLCGKDVPGNFLQTRGAHIMKALTGGDALTTEVKGNMQSNQIAGEFAIIVTSNSRLRVHLDGDSGAWRRRLLIVQFERPKVATPIPDFGRMILETEGDGVLRWAAGGAYDLEMRDYQFPVTPEQQARTDSLLDESNALATFVQTCIQSATPGDLTTVEIIKAFNHFCDERGWTPCSVREIERNLPDLMMEFHRVSKSSSVRRDNKDQKGFRSVALKTPC